MSDPAAIARRERIMQALVAALEAAMPPGKVERNRDTDPDASECPVLIARDGPHDASQVNSGLTDYAMRVGIDGAETADSRGALGPALSALYLRTVRALVSDPTLGELCTDVREVSFDPRFARAADSDSPLAFFSLDLEVRFSTPDGDPAGAA